MRSKSVRISDHTNPASIDESATLEEAKQVFKTFSEENQKHFDDMVKEEITTRAVAEKLGNKNFLHEHGKEHRFAIMRAIAHLRKLGSSLIHRSKADKFLPLTNWTEIPNEKPKCHMFF